MKILLLNEEDFNKWRDELIKCFPSNSISNVPEKFPCVAVWSTWETWDAKDIVEYDYVYLNDFEE